MWWQTDRKFSFFMHDCHTQKQKETTDVLQGPVVSPTTLTVHCTIWLPSCLAVKLHRLTRKCHKMRTWGFKETTSLASQVRTAGGGNTFTYPDTHTLCLLPCSGTTGGTTGLSCALKKACHCLHWKKSSSNFSWDNWILWRKILSHSNFKSLTKSC